MSGLWRSLAKKHPETFNTHTVPVWATLVPIIAGGCAWCTYMCMRTLFKTNDIVLKNIDGVAEPWLVRSHPKLYPRQGALDAHERLKKKMDSL